MSDITDLLGDDTLPPIPDFPPVTDAFGNTPAGYGTSGYEDDWEKYIGKLDGAAGNIPGEDIGSHCEDSTNYMLNKLYALYGDASAIMGTYGYVLAGLKTAIDSFADTKSKNFTAMISQSHQINGDGIIQGITNLRDNIFKPLEDNLSAKFGREGQVFNEDIDQIINNLNEAISDIKNPKDSNIKLTGTIDLSDLNIDSDDHIVGPVAAGGKDNTSEYNKEVAELHAMQSILDHVETTLTGVSKAAQAKLTQLSSVQQQALGAFSGVAKSVASVDKTMVNNQKTG